VDTARVATDLGLLVNAGHDLNLANLGALHQHIPWLHEVSIGHALVSDALYLGLENTVRLYARTLQKPLSGG
jgi:pyridoxine 5-phosphate synthase